MGAISMFGAQLEGCVWNQVSGKRNNEGAVGDAVQMRVDSLQFSSSILS